MGTDKAEGPESANDDGPGDHADEATGPDAVVLGRSR